MIYRIIAGIAITLILAGIYWYQESNTSKPPPVQSYQQDSNSEGIKIY